VPRSGAQTLSDLRINGNERVFVGCEKCSRPGSYALASFIALHGIDKGLPDLLAELSRDCPKRTPHGLDRCGAVYRPG
jgi:hypothetical protein